MTLNRYIYRKESEHMATKSVKITEKTTSIRETNTPTLDSVPFSPLRRELDELKMMIAK